jgi:hypothetical protein
VKFCLNQKSRCKKLFIFLEVLQLQTALPHQCKGIEKPFDNQPPSSNNIAGGTSISTSRKEHKREIEAEQCYSPASELVAPSSSFLTSSISSLSESSVTSSNSALKPLKNPKEFWQEERQKLAEAEQIAESIARERSILDDIAEGRQESAPVTRNKEDNKGEALLPSPERIGHLGLQASRSEDFTGRRHPKGRYGAHKPKEKRVWVAKENQGRADRTFPSK